MKSKVAFLFIILILILAGCSSNNNDQIKTLTDEFEALKRENQELTDRVNKLEDELTLTNTEKTNQIYKVEWLLKKMEGIEHKTVYINSYSKEKKQLNVNEIEWVQSKERLLDIGVDEDSMPNGFYIYDEEKQNDTYQLSQDFICELLDANNQSVLRNQDDLWSYLLEDEKIRGNYPFDVYIINHQVVEVVQRYIP